MAFEIFPWGEIHRGNRAKNIRQILTDMKDCGFTGAGFLEPQDVELCKETGLTPYSFLFCGELERSPKESGFYISSRGESSVALLSKDKNASPEYIDEIMRKALADFPDTPAHIFLCDEPGASEFSRIRLMAEALKKYRPDLTPYINLFPNYAVCGAPDTSQLETPTYEEYLDRFCEELPGMPISLDNYMVMISGNFENAAQRRHYFYNFVQAQEACVKHGVDFHHVICSNQLRSNLVIPTFENLLAEANTSLAAGSRTISWFTYFGRSGYFCAPVDDTTEEDIRTPTWYLIKEINRHIISYGRELENMEYCGMYFTDTDSIPRAKSISEADCIESIEADCPCVVGVYRQSDGRPAVFAVNISLNRPTRINLKIKGGLGQVWNIEQNIFRSPLLSVGNASSPLWLAPGDAVLMR